MRALRKVNLSTLLKFRSKIERYIIYNIVEKLQSKQTRILTPFLCLFTASMGEIYFQPVSCRFRLVLEELYIYMSTVRSKRITSLA